MSNAQYPGTTDEVIESILADGRNLMDPWSFIRITSQHTGLNRQSALKDRSIVQIRAGLDFYSEIDPGHLDGQVDTLNARLEKLTANNPCYRKSNGSQQSETRKREVHKSYNGF